MSTLPKLIALQNWRCPQDNIPETRAERDALHKAVRRYSERKKFIPPMPMNELREHAEIIVKEEGYPLKYADYIGVIFNSEIWREELAKIPYERRLLLLPKCLRVESKCPAPFDEFGLLCKECGLCTIQDLQAEAERLGYAVLVAEGSAIVMSIIKTGKIDAIVGVSCLSVLEKSFPFMEAAAIPGVAIPLLQDDCKDTNVDIDMVWDVIHLTSDDKSRRMDLDLIRADVDKWFDEKTLIEEMGTPEEASSKMAVEFMSRAGKRWRPFLSVAVFQALAKNPLAKIPEKLRKIAVAVECFHKASLIHDDIEDAEEMRDGLATVHETNGIPLAINAGDYLVGEGYRLLSESKLSGSRRAELVRVAARGHRTLCIGQGKELSMGNTAKILRSKEVIEIFRAKTSPAFEVALDIGAVVAGADKKTREVLRLYSDALGIAYQIRDDLDDFTEETNRRHKSRRGPSLLLSLAYERAMNEEKAVVLRYHNSGALTDLPQLQEIMVKRKVRGRAEQLYEAYKEEAVRSLQVLENHSLKGLLRRIVGKIFKEFTIKGWCSEFSPGNAASREARSSVTG